MAIILSGNLEAAGYFPITESKYIKGGGFVVSSETTPIVTVLNNLSTDVTTKDKMLVGITEVYDSYAKKYYKLTNTGWVEMLPPVALDTSLLDGALTNSVPSSVAVKKYVDDKISANTTTVFRGSIDTLKTSPVDIVNHTFYQCSYTSETSEGYGIINLNVDDSNVSVGKYITLFDISGGLSFAVISSGYDKSVKITSVANNVITVDGKFNEELGVIQGNYYYFITNVSIKEDLSNLRVPYSYAVGDTYKLASSGNYPIATKQVIVASALNYNTASITLAPADSTYFTNGKILINEIEVVNYTKVGDVLNLVSTESEFDFPTDSMITITQGNSTVLGKAISSGQAKILFNNYMKGATIKVNINDVYETVGVVNSVNAGKTEITLTSNNTLPSGNYQDFKIVYNSRLNHSTNATIREYTPILANASDNIISLSIRTSGGGGWVISDWVFDASSSGNVSVVGSVNDLEIPVFKDTTGRALESSGIKLFDIRKKYAATVNTVANTYLVISHNLATEDVDITIKNSSNQLVIVECQIVNENQIQIKTNANQTGLKVSIIG